MASKKVSAMTKASTKIRECSSQRARDTRTGRCNAHLEVNIAHLLAPLLFVKRAIQRDEGNE